MTDIANNQDLPMKPLDIYKEYLKNSNTAEPYEASILWGLRRNESLDVLFGKSVELVGKILDDPEFSDLCQKGIHQDI